MARIGRPMSMACSDSSARPDAIVGCFLIVQVVRLGASPAIGASRGGWKPRSITQRAVVLVDEPTEQVPPTDVARVDQDPSAGRYERWSQADGTVRPLPL